MLIRTLLLTVLAFGFLLHEASAQVCGRIDGLAQRSRAVDALAALRSSVGTAGACRLCLCDVDGDGFVRSGDALAILRRAVGAETSFSCAPCSCSAPERIGLGQHPRVLQLADLDRDGLLDVVSAEDESRTVSVLRGIADGRFAARETVDVGGAPLSVTVAALNPDAIPDLVTANLDPSAIAVLTGTGDGSFNAPLLLGAGNAPVHVAVGDLTGDGRPDLVAANSLSDDLSVYVALAEGGYSEATRAAVGIGPRWVELADLTGDGRLDAVTANRDSHSVTILAGKGDATFEPARTFSVCSGAHQAIPADLDADSDIDLVVPCKADRSIAVLLGSGGGELAPPVLYETNAPVLAVAIADLDRDGRPEIVGTQWGGSSAQIQVVILRSLGSGTFESPVFAGARVKPRGVVVGDVSGDGLPDVLTANTESNDLLLFRGSGQAELGKIELIATPALLRDFAAGNFAGDEHPELVGVGWQSFGAVYARDPERDVVDGVGQIDLPRFPSDVVTGDFNGDGKDDIVVKNNKVAAPSPGKRCTDPHLALFLGRGDATFETELRVAAANLTHHTDDDFVAADVDDDGIDDLVVIERQSTAVGFMRGTPSGQFEVVQRIVVDTAAADLTTGDFNDDDAPDIAFVQGDQAREVIVRLRDMYLRFGNSATATLSIDTPVRWLTTGDMDLDGRSDLVVGKEGVTTIETRLARADATFGEPVVSDLGVELFETPQLADIDVDGILDLVGMRRIGPDDPRLPRGSNIVLAAGGKDGSFAQAHTVPTGGDEPTLASASTSAVLVMDLDHDPFPDLVVGRSSGGRGTASILYDVGNCLVRAP